MVVAETIVHQKDNLDKFLIFPPEQHPIVLQIGGSNLDNLAKAAELANAYGYDEINLNCGCPSGKVAGHGCFGVRLMLDPKKFVGEAMSAIASSSSVPISVKCRIGVDDHDSYDELYIGFSGEHHVAHGNFIDTVASLSPTRHFIIHARKALLNGISPAQNRTVPPLKYKYYYALLRDFPELQLTINGGITSVEEVRLGKSAIAARKQGAHGVMVGRAAYNNPWSTLGHVDATVYGTTSNGLSRRQPLLNIFHSEPGNGLWKRKADAALCHCKTVKSFLDETLDAFPDSVLDSTIAESSSAGEDAFANVHDLLPPPYKSREQETGAEKWSSWKQPRGPEKEKPLKGKNPPFFYPLVAQSSTLIDVLIMALSGYLFRQMIGKKGIITTEDLASLRLRYHISNLFEFWRGRPLGATAKAVSV
ncbi:hypothetical protein ACLOJK_014962 [Asimina triloba]